MGRGLPFPIQLAAMAATGFVGMFALDWASTDGVSAAQSLMAQAPASQCRIKGNISSGGERIYHMPGQDYYDITLIRPEYGERWFCSEAEALAAGWRRSKV